MELGYLTNLTELEISAEIDSRDLREQIGGLTNLTWLSFENNLLAGSMPGISPA